MAEIDETLELRPTPEAIVVTLVPTSARIPTALTQGDRVFEPSYLMSFLMGLSEPVEDIPLLVRLSVPAGTPALFQEPALPGNPGTLLLARGIEWEVMRVVKLPSQTMVTARVIERRPQQLRD
ncbi:hypothetical protein [Leucobacter denitrificans]|uniref:Uncharacterized protein n=1 Tax=Leucobacter denitrificans TaxID=683042 RepID=A0A7G9S4E4_9MICO|nr:hypothetical protein [Leucobacter denitrificans]QNN62719.1 hypothetical protein H9L06_10935 [Leucobacter denitrificans]